MTLAELVLDLPVTQMAPSHSSATPQQLQRQVGDLEVVGICHDSRCLKPGELFVTWQGENYDGRRFVPQAIARGAVAVVAAAPPLAEHEPLPAMPAMPAIPAMPLPWLLTPAPRALLAPLAARLYRHPDRELTMVGVTGTNGKSTVTALVAAMLSAAGHATGRLGTLGYTFQGRRFAGERTTPEASDFFRILRQMRQAGAAAVVLEVSSHALAQGRVSEARFDACVFTNLSRDHFDLHSDFEDYFETKKRLFHQRKDSATSVVYLDDPYGRRLAAELPGAMGFGTSPEAQVQLTEVELEGRSSRGCIRTPRGELTFATPLLGRYNVVNVLAAVAVAEALELPHPAVLAALAEQSPLPGRLQPVECGQPFPVFVDYAHTPGALEAALRSLKEMTGDKVVLVFGCGGERDPGKRRLMGRLAGEIADLVLLTHDNPRREDPTAILAAVEAGIRDNPHPAYRVVPDRRQAIADAVAAAGPGWAVLVAGKGHEEVQIVGDERRPFSDRQELERALEARFGDQATG